MLRAHMGTKPKTPIDGARKILPITWPKGLVHIDYLLPIFICTDACKEGIGGAHVGERNLLLSAIRRGYNRQNAAVLVGIGFWRVFLVLARQRAK